MLCLMMKLISGCSHIILTECQAFKPFRPNRASVFTERDKRWVVEHNEKGKALCGWEFPKAEAVTQ